MHALCILMQRKATHPVNMHPVNLHSLKHSMLCSAARIIGSAESTDALFSSLHACYACVVLAALNPDQLQKASHLN